MEIQRQDPDRLLQAIREDGTEKTQGKLKIFFGYAAGVGKTYAMLEAAHQARTKGMDVVAGYIEPHDRPQTSALLCGLEQLPVRQIRHGQMVLREFDLDAALNRKPQLILVDELAHTNAEGCRHTKRYQDVQELLRSGINVYTTVNVQHIESLNDTVASVTGVMVRERIPDYIFDQADQVELVDIEPRDLLERMSNGNIYGQEQAKKAVGNFFKVDNLTALREIALRRCADRVNLRTENARVRNRGDYHTDEHILVCLSSSPSNARIIRTAARMATAFHGNFTALFVETPRTAAMDEADKKRLRDNMRLAEQLGAAIETVYGEDVSYQIAEYARLSGVSKVVIGRSALGSHHLFGKPSLTDRLIANAPNLDVHIIPDASAGNDYPSVKKRLAGNMTLPIRDVGKSILVLLAATLLAYAFYALGFTEPNIIIAYLLAVLVISVITTSHLCSLLASVVGVLVFNFFFTVPRFTFHFNDPGYIVTFAIMFLASILTGSLASRLKQNARQAAQSAFRTKILFETNQLLQKEHDEMAVISATAGQIMKLLQRDLVIYPAREKELSEPCIYHAGNRDCGQLLAENEKTVAFWVMQNNKHAGATTDTLSSARCMYLAIRVNQTVYGVVGIDMEDGPLDSFENSVLLSILGECALALENIRNMQEKEKAAILAKNEQLRANLLRTISHDLRTPLTSISGNASNLLANDQKMDPQTRHQIFTDIYEDSLWLINLVENLLAITRIEGGQVNLNSSVELMEEVISEAMRHINRRGKEYDIRVNYDQELILAQIDAKLIVQVLINLVDNAIKYTPKGSVIKIGCRQEGKQVVVTVADNGPGIPDEQKERIFDMFYCGSHRVADSRRSMGLGLALCKTIVTAHGGTIVVSDNQPQGAVFTFTLPAGEVELHE